MKDHTVVEAALACPECSRAQQEYGETTEHRCVGCGGPVPQGALGDALRSRAGDPRPRFCVDCFTHGSRGR